MLAPNQIVDRRFGLLRLAAYVTRAIAILLLLVGLMGALALGLALLRLPDFTPFAATFTLLQVGAVLLSALAVASVAELCLVLLAIEENTRAGAAAAHSTSQALHQQAEMAAALATIAQNTRYAADDILRAGKLLEQIADEQRRGEAVLPGLAAQVKDLLDQGRQAGNRLAIIETVARAYAHRHLRPPTSGSPVA